MPQFTRDGIQFHFEETGMGLPFIFQHGLGGDVTQPSAFSNRRRASAQEGGKAKPAALVSRRARQSSRRRQPESGSGSIAMRWARATAKVSQNGTGKYHEIWTWE